MYTLTYAWQYYAEEPGGIDVNQETLPGYTNFASLARTIGMTCSVPDASVRSTPMRRIVLRHSLISFLFGTGVLAVVISLVPSLAP